MNLNNAGTRINASNLEATVLGMLYVKFKRERLSDEQRRECIKQARDKNGEFALRAMGSSTPAAERCFKYGEIYLEDPRIVGLEFSNGLTWTVELHTAIEQMNIREWGLQAFTLAYLATRKQLPRNEAFVTPFWHWHEIRSLTAGGDSNVEGITFLIDDDDTWKVARFVPVDEEWTYGVNDGNSKIGIHEITREFADYIAARILSTDVPNHAFDAQFQPSNTYTKEGLMTMAKILCLMESKPVTEADAMVSGGLEMKLLEDIHIAMGTELKDVGLGGQGKHVQDVHLMRHRLQTTLVEKGKGAAKRPTHLQDATDLADIPQDDARAKDGLNTYQTDDDDASSDEELSDDEMSDEETNLVKPPDPDWFDKLTIGEQQEKYEETMRKWLEEQ